MAHLEANNADLLNRCRAAEAAAVAESAAADALRAENLELASKLANAAQHAAADAPRQAEAGAESAAVDALHAEDLELASKLAAADAAQHAAAPKPARSSSRCTSWRKIPPRLLRLALWTMVWIKMILSPMILHLCLAKRNQRRSLACQSQDIQLNKWMRQVTDVMLLFWW